MFDKELLDEETFLAEHVEEEEDSKPGPTDVPEEQYPVEYDEPLLASHQPQKIVLTQDEQLVFEEHREE